MCEYLKIGDDLFYRAPFESQYLGPFSWGDSEFDVFVAILDSIPQMEQMRETLEKLVALNNDWIETLGPESEALHDHIDQASVNVGRQAAVGDGFPMTAWHKRLVRSDEMADYITCGGLGASYYKLVLVIGSKKHRIRFAEQMKQQMHSRQEDE